MLRFIKVLKRKKKIRRMINIIHDELINTYKVSPETLEEDLPYVLMDMYVSVLEIGDLSYHVVSKYCEYFFDNKLDVRQVITLNKICIEVFLYFKENLSKIKLRDDIAEFIYSIMTIKDGYIKLSSLSVIQKYYKFKKIISGNLYLYNDESYSDADILIEGINIDLFHFPRMTSRIGVESVQFDELDVYDSIVKHSLINKSSELSTKKMFSLLTFPILNDPIDKITLDVVDLDKLNKIILEAK